MHEKFRKTNSELQYRFRWKGLTFNFISVEGKTVFVQKMGRGRGDMWNEDDISYPDECYMLCAPVGEGRVSLMDTGEDYVVTFPSGYGRGILTTPWLGRTLIIPREQWCRSVPFDIKKSCIGEFIVISVIYMLLIASLPIFLYYR